MQNFQKILLFLASNVGGYFSIALLGNFAVLAGLYPKLPTDDAVHHFQLVLFGGGMWVWIAGALFSIGFFFAPRAVRLWLLLAPLCMTALYGLAVLIYFNYSTPG